MAIRTADATTGDRTSTDVDPYATPLEVLALVSKEVATEYSVFPLEVDEAGRLVLVSNDLLSPPALERLADAVGRAIDVRLATRGDVAFAIRRGYERLEDGHEGDRARPEPVGQRLIARRIVTHEQLEEALRQQRRGYARLGDLLVEQGSITAESLGRAVSDFLEAGSVGRLGDFLVERGFVSTADVDRALEEQRRRSPKLGEMLVALGFVDRIPDDG